MDINRVAFDGAPGGMPHDAAIAEYVYDYSANAAEVETGGVRLNLIPKEGSNTFSGGFYGDFSHPGLLANNVDQDLVDRGLVGGMGGGLLLVQAGRHPATELVRQQGHGRLEVRAGPRQSDRRQPDALRVDVAASGHAVDEYGLDALPWTSYITVFGNPIQARFSARPNETNQLTNLGLYAQEQWTVDRLTVNAGIRTRLPSRCGSRRCRARSRA